ncbi:SCO1664 family protein [Anaerolineales bacterium HSG6]|nr:SCO1664 family protein [Anaerolineales bacterium HSG6]MDM8533042.1 SCO1664 family protein [Anaerolineales bacterium HSG25]
MSNNILQTLKTVRQLGQIKPYTVGEESLLTRLLDGDMELEGLMPWSSNYTFLVKVAHADLAEPLLGIYKPGKGERRLWDFPNNTLHKREFMSYLLSQALGWPDIPITVLRDGPHGEGSVQLFVDAEYEVHYFTMRDDETLDDTFRRVALFDVISNNADRKAGHCLQDKAGRIWAIDHGLTFHTDFKLRTVIHEVCAETISDPLLQDLTRLYEVLTDSNELSQILCQFIDYDEVDAFRERISELLTDKHYPQLSPYNVPYPPI